MVVTHPYFDLDTPIVIGHRGCAGEVPENTLASFEAALDAGAAILESDVHLTRDGVPVLIHDDAVDRVSDGSGRVGELGLAELERLDAGHRFDPDGTGRHPFRGRGLRIPSLAEALAGFPTARFNLELKEDVPVHLLGNASVEGPEQISRDRVRVARRRSAPRCLPGLRAVR